IGVPASVLVTSSLSSLDSIGSGSLRSVPIHAALNLSPIGVRVERAVQLSPCFLIAEVDAIRCSQEARGSVRIVKGREEALQTILRRPALDELELPEHLRERDRTLFGPGLSL